MLLRSEPHPEGFLFLYRGYLSFRNVDRFFALTLEVLGEVVDHAPVEILVHVAEAVPLQRQES